MPKMMKAEEIKRLMKGSANDFVYKFPEVAATALAALERVEELEKESLQRELLIKVVGLARSLFILPL